MKCRYLTCTNSCSETEFCSTTCRNKFNRDLDRVAQSKATTAPCKVCPFRRAESWLDCESHLLTQVDASLMRPIPCITASLHCNMTKRCKGADICLSGGNENVYSLEEFMKLPPDQNESNADLYMTRVFGDDPKSTVVTRSGRSYWYDTGEAATTPDGLPFPEGEAAYPFAAEYNKWCRKLFDQKYKAEMLKEIHNQIEETNNV